MLSHFLVLTKLCFFNIAHTNKLLLSYNSFKLPYPSSLFSRYPVPHLPLHFNVILPKRVISKMIATMLMPSGHHHHHRRSPPCAFPRFPELLARDLMVNESFDLPEHVVVVMDGLKEFSVEPLEWILKNMRLDTCCIITLLGVKPWLNIPLFSKTWSDVWTTTDLEEMLTSKDKEWKTDARYLKAHPLVDLCLKYGVVPQIKTEMGFPQKLLVLEKITSSYATLVVFDRHHDRKDIHFYAEKVPCNILVMNNHGGADWVRGRPRTDHDKGAIPGDVPLCSIPTPKLMLSDHVKRILGLKVRKSRN